MIVNNKFIFSILFLGLLSIFVEAQTRVHHRSTRDVSQEQTEEDKQQKLQAATKQYLQQLDDGLAKMELPVLADDQKAKIQDLYGTYKQSITRIDDAEDLNHKQRISSKARFTTSFNNDLKEILSEEQAKYLDSQFRKEWQAKKNAPKEPKTVAPTSGDMATSDLLKIDVAVDGAGLAPLEKGKKNQLKNLLLQRQMDMNRYESAALTESILYGINSKFSEAIKGFLDQEYITVITQALSQ